VFVGRSIFKFCINFLRYRALSATLCALFSYNWLKVQNS